MTRKVIISIIAIVMCIGVIGGCFALYYTKGADKTVTISSSYSELNLVINNAGNTAEQTAISLSGFSPASEDLTKTIDVTLAVDHPQLVDGIQGNFKVALTGTLAPYITTSVGTLASIGAENTSADITSEATSNAGKNIALSSTPVYVRLSFTLNTEAEGFNFATLAESTASLTLSWTQVAGTVWTLDNDAYYLVGNIGGVDKWNVNATNQNVMLNDTTTDSNTAQKNSVSLTAGDKIKVRKGDGTWINIAGDQPGYTYDGDGNYVVGTTGTYGIYVSNGVVYVALNS